MSEFKWRHFSGEIILQCVRWYCKYGISYRDLEEMMTDLEWDELEKALESIRHESHPTPPLSLCGYYQDLCNFAG
jgi:transposase-like protein